MSKQNDLGAFLRQFQDRRRNAFDARRVGHLAVFHRNVEVHADENTLSSDVVEVVESLESWHWDNPFVSALEGGRP